MGTAHPSLFSIQTIARRRRPDVDLVIVDEAHQLHREVFRWMKDCPTFYSSGCQQRLGPEALGSFTTT